MSPYSRVTLVVGPETAGAVVIVAGQSLGVMCDRIVTHGVGVEHACTCDAAPFDNPPNGIHQCPPQPSVSWKHWQWWWW
jgi:hypothetical protein